MQDNCPICAQELNKERKTIKTMLMSFGYQYDFVECSTCEYRADFLAGPDYRPMIVAAAFRSMIWDLKMWHAGSQIDEIKKTNYKKFVNTFEFQNMSGQWDGLMFWEDNKHLLSNL